MSRGFLNGVHDLLLNFKLSHKFIVPQAVEVRSKDNLLRLDIYVYSLFIDDMICYISFSLSCYYFYCGC